ncbi:MAG: protein translocase subunit SecF [Candidatus Pacebacteria bacterium]|nr:protein translocase subunit SecF [Candidatus Paceibacterota bacterium]
MKILHYRNYFFFISAFLVLASLGALLFKGLNFGIDFTGGAFVEVSYVDNVPELSEVQALLSESGFSAKVQPFGENGFIVRTQDLTHEEHLSLISAVTFEDSIPTEERFTSIGPSLGQELKSKAMIALALVLIAIILFVAFAFRHVSKPISSWNYGIVAVIALIHDVIIPAGIFALLGREIDALFVVGMLSILGLSVNDTIVVFDRVRENLHENTKNHTQETFITTVGNSIQQTLVRSVNTSVTLVVVLISLFIFGPESTQNLALVLLIGTIIGTYSSIFLASPMLVSLNREEK